MANHGAKTNRQFTVADVAPVVAGKTPKERLIWNAPGTGV
jgi:hypothetical protein